MSSASSIFTSSNTGETQMQPNVSKLSLAKQEAAGFKFISVVTEDCALGRKGDAYRY